MIVDLIVVVLDLFFVFYYSSFMSLMVSCGVEKMYYYKEDRNVDVFSFSIPSFGVDELILIMFSSGKILRGQE